MPIKVAAIQFAPDKGSKTENLRALADLVIQAAENDAQLIVCPELAVTGYSFMNDAEARAQAEVIPGTSESMKVMQAISSKYRVNIAWGLVEQDEGTDSLFNSQVLVTPDSYVSYRKVNRWGSDFLWATAGRANPPVLSVDFDSGEQKKVGLVICRDIRDTVDKDWESFYEKGDADIVVMSSNWGDGGFPAVPWIKFAQENAVWLVVSNRYGEELPNDFGEGGVCVIEPCGKVHADGVIWNQDCIVYAEVD